MPDICLIILTPTKGKTQRKRAMVSNKTWGEVPPFIMKGDDFYEVATSVLFAN